MASAGALVFRAFCFPPSGCPCAWPVIGCGRRATLRPLLRLLALLWRRRLTVSALHSFSLGARFIRISSTSRRRDLLMKSGRWTAARLLVFSCAQRCRRAEPLTLQSSLVTLRRSLSCPAMRGIWLPHLVVVLAGDHVVAVAAAHPRKLTAVLLSLLRPGRAREIARLV